MSLNLLITRQLNDDSPIFDLEEVNIYAESFIEIIISKETTDLSKFDWLFFSSANGVQWALENKLDLSKIKVAVIGTPTAKFLEEAGVKVSFTGNDAETTEQISQNFNASLQTGENVLFPISSVSKKTVLKGFTNPFEEFIAYQTLLDPLLIEDDLDIYVFTSPSNFKSFFSANKVDEEKIVVAIGEVTKAEIEKSLNMSIFTPKEKTEKSIYELLKDLIPSYFPNN